MSCGHTNEYSAAAPKKCEKCKQEFTAVAKDVIRIAQQRDDKPPKVTKAVFEEEDEDEIEDSDFEGYMDFEPEPVSESEMSRIFLANASKPINLKDLVEQGEKSAPIQKKEPKKRGRPRKS